MKIYFPELDIVIMRKHCEHYAAPWEWSGKCPSEESITLLKLALL